MTQIYLVQSSIVENGTTSFFTVKAFSNEYAAIRFLNWRKSIITDADKVEDETERKGFEAWFSKKGRLQAWYIGTMDLEDDWE